MIPASGTRQRILATAPIFLGLLAVAFLRTYSPNRESIYSAHGAVAFVVIVGACVVAWFGSTSGAIRREVYPLLGLLAALWLLLSASTVIHASDLPMANVSGLVNSLMIQITMGMFVVIWMSISRRNEPNRPTRWLAWFLAVFGLASGLAAVQLLATGSTLAGPFKISQELRWMQLYGWYASPNYLVDSVALGLLASLYLYFEGQKLARFALVLTMIHALLLLFTGSRAGIGGAILAVGWQYATLVRGRGARNTRNLRAKAARLVLLALAGAAVVVAFVFRTIGEGFEGYAQHLWRYHQLTRDGRMYIWGEALEVFRSSSILELLFGRGNNMYAETYARSLHNSYLQLLIDHGVLSLIGLAIFAYWFFSMVRVSLILPGTGRVRGTVAFLSATVVYTLSRSFFHGALLLSGSLAWCVTVLAAGMMLRLLTIQRSLLPVRIGIPKGAAGSGRPRTRGLANE